MLLLEWEKLEEWLEIADSLTARKTEIIVISLFRQYIEFLWRRTKFNELYHFKIVKKMIETKARKCVYFYNVKKSLVILCISLYIHFYSYEVKNFHQCVLFLQNRKKNWMICIRSKNQNVLETENGSYIYF